MNMVIHHLGYSLSSERYEPKPTENWKEFMKHPMTKEVKNDLGKTPFDYATGYQKLI